MTVAELISELSKYPPNEKVYRDGGEYKDDYQQVSTTKQFSSWGLKGVLIE